MADGGTARFRVLAVRGSGEDTLATVELLDTSLRGRGMTLVGELPPQVDQDVRAMGLATMELPRASFLPRMAAQVGARPGDNRDLLRAVATELAATAAGRPVGHVADVPSDPDALPEAHREALLVGVRDDGRLAALCMEGRDAGRVLALEGTLPDDVATALADGTPVPVAVADRLDAEVVPVDEWLVSR